MIGDEEDEGSSMPRPLFNSLENDRFGDSEGSGTEDESSGAPTGRRGSRKGSKYPLSGGKRPMMKTYTEPSSDDDAGILDLARCLG